MYFNIDLHKNIKNNNYNVKKKDLKAFVRGDIIR